MKTMTVPVYVLADDGRLYRDPVIEGASFGSPWLLRFDADDPTEFCIVADPRLQRSAACSAALAEAGICAAVRSVPRTEERYVNGRLTTCLVWNVDVMRPVPAEILAGQSGVVQPRGEHVLYAFGKLWG